jgi:5'-phosphate synthase pdxT subunit
LVKTKNRPTIGILGLQGAVEAHADMFAACGADIKIIISPADLEGIDALVIPGGESTTQKKLLDFNQLSSALAQKISEGLPVLGTCAGLVMLAKEVDGGSPSKLSFMNVKVKRNAYGSQLDSFETYVDIKGIEGQFPAIMIRAPYIMDVADGVEVLATFEGKILAAREKNLWGCAFHPELSGDNRFHRMFLDYVDEHKAS